MKTKLINKEEELKIYKIKKENPFTPLISIIGGDKMDFFNEEKIHIYLSYVLVLLCFVLAIAFFLFANKIKHIKAVSEESTSKVTEEVEKIEEIKEEIDTPIEEEKIKVDIKGAVKTPGVYEVGKEAVVQDVITLAGGLKANGSTQFINLALKVKDQMVIRILTSSELKELEKEEKELCICDTIDTSSCKEAVVIVPSDKEITDTSKKDDTNQKENPTDEKKKEEKDDLVSINTATAKELMSISGIGEAKANAIIAHREKNGPFQAIEDIKTVSGIGEALYNKIKDYIKL